MNETHATASLTTVAVLGMVAAMATADIDWTTHAAVSALQPHQTANTYSHFARSLTFKRTELTDAEFSHRVADVYANLLASQQSLGAEFERVLMKGLGQLYET